MTEEEAKAPAVEASVPRAVEASPSPASDASVPPDLARRLEEGLGMGFLPTVFILLAGHERHLRAATEAFLAQPLDAMEEHGQAIRRLGADAGARLIQRPWQLDASAREIGSLIDAYNVVNPPSLLFTLFLSPAPTRSFRIMEPPLPPRPTRPDRRALLADIDACHGSFKLPGSGASSPRPGPSTPRPLGAWCERCPSRPALPAPVRPCARSRRR